MANLLISLGANLGNSYETMIAASCMLNEAFGRECVRFSKLYRTPPVGGPMGQSDFLNAVARIQTRLSCWEVWDVVKRIEKDLGRQRLYRWEARRLDMDILLYGKERVWTPHLKIPHPRMVMRSFVLVPAMDVAPDMIEPVTGWNIAQLLCNLQNAADSDMVIYSDSQESSKNLALALQANPPALKQPSLRFATCESPSRIATLSEVETPHAVLRIFSVRTPEPETIQWEDFAHSWATALGMVGDGNGTALIGPRYLLPDNDTAWTVHEIEASRQATTCPIQADDRPFGDSRL